MHRCIPASVYVCRHLCVSVMCVCVHVHISVCVCVHVLTGVHPHSLVWSPQGQGGFLSVPSPWLAFNQAVSGALATACGLSWEPLTPPDMVSAHSPRAGWSVAFLWQPPLHYCQYLPVALAASPGPCSRDSTRLGCPQEQPPAQCRTPGLKVSGYVLGRK